MFLHNCGFNTSHLTRRSTIDCGTPAEVFPTFIPNTEHKSEELDTAIINTLASIETNLNNCRQSYDYAANVSVAYTGLQERIKVANKFDEIISCLAHSLNLVITSAASC